MQRFLRIIRDPENRKALGWVGGGLLVLGPALWAVITYFFPAETSPPAVIEPPVRVEAEGGSIASGRDTNIQGDFRPGGSAPRPGAEGASE
jgi:hypothetical protein